MAVRVLVARQADFTPTQWNALGNLALAFKEIPDGALPEIKKAYPGTNQETAQQFLQHMMAAEREFLFGSEGRLGVVDEQEATAEREAVRVSIRTRQQQRQAAWPEE
jgi:hypothetical protein